MTRLKLPCLLSLLAYASQYAVAAMSQPESQMPIQPPKLTPAWPSPQPVSHIESITLVDLLSADPDYSLLLRLLQRSRLITTLNKLNGSTFFAPTNEAVRAAIVLPHGDDDRDLYIWIDQELSDPHATAMPPVDNIQARLRATLLYHTLNYTLQYNSSDAPFAVPHLHETLLQPHPKEGTGPPGEPPMAIPMVACSAVKARKFAWCVEQCLVRPRLEANSIPMTLAM